MVLSDFLSRQKTGDSNSHKLIPISIMLRINWTIISIELIAELISPKLMNIWYKLDHKQNLAASKY